MFIICAQHFHLKCIKQGVLSVVLLLIMQVGGAVFAHGNTTSDLSSPPSPALTQTPNIEPQTWKLLDKNTSLNLAQIIALSDASWQPLKDQVTGYHFMDEDYWAASKGAVLWLKMELLGSAKMDTLWLEILPNTGVDGEIAVFDKGTWAWQKPVQRMTAGALSQPARYLTFALDASPQNRTVYFRLTSAQTFQFSLKAQSTDQLLWYFMISNLFFGLVAGMLLLALIYNLMIGLNAKEPVYLYYALYVFCNLLYCLVTGGYFRVLFPDWVGINTAIITNTTMSLIGLSAFIFVRKFLDTKTYLPKFDPVLRVTIVAYLMTIVSLSFVSDFYSYLFVISIGVISPLIALIAGILSYRQGHPVARYFLIAWTFFLITATFWGLMWLGVVEPKDWVIWLYLLGSLLEVLLLSTVLGFRFNHLKMKTLSLNADKSRYRSLSETDDLTQVLNRRGFIKKVEQLAHSCNNEKLVWLALDIDNFKAFNDQHGHIAGDQLLQKMGTLLNKKGRKEHAVGRIGGEEFAIMLINCTLPDAKHFMDRLLIDFSLIQVTSKQEVEVGTTLSIGATEIRLGENVQTIWKRADDLLYRAKEGGRNRAVTA